MVFGVFFGIFAFFEANMGKNMGDSKVFVWEGYEGTH